MVHRADLELTAEEIRVLGCLIEKERATPDQYPLSTNALRTACNQKSSRDPVVDYSDTLVEQTMLSLRDKGFARTVRGGGRTDKHKQAFDEALELTGGQVSVLAVLMLRGAQTANELRTRTDRLHGFAANSEVDVTLAELEAASPPLVRCIGRQPGQREDRWVHLLAADGAEAAGAAESPATTAGPATTGPAPEAAPAGASPVDAGATVGSRADAGPPPAPRPSVAARSGELASTPSADPDPEPDRGAHERERVARLEGEVTELRSELAELRRRFDELAAELGLPT